MPNKPSRPLSPHLQVYKPQLTTGMSIFHRMTGVALAVGLPVFVIWLVCLSQGPESYSSFMGYAHSTIGQIMLFGWTLSFFYHFWCGIRHLLWDAGFFLTIKGVYTTGYIALALALFMTASVWLTAYKVWS